MRMRNMTAVGLLLVGISADRAWAGLAATPRSESAAHRKWAEASLRMQMPFIENVGQIKEAGIRFYAKTFAGTVYVAASGRLMYVLPQGGWDNSAGDEHPACMIAEECVGGSASAPQGRERSAARANFFLGRDPASWKTGVPAYGVVVCADIYPGIDLAVRARGRTVEKIFTLQPGADAEDIAIRVDGVEQLAVDGQGRLVARRGLGELVFSRPVAYQQGAAGREDVAVVYRVHGDGYGFELGDYDSDRPLVIDPLLGCTYHGGTAWDAAEAVAVDGQGRVYVVGFTGSDDFPVTDGAFQTRRLGNNAFVSLFDAKLTNLLASTYLGGTNGDTAYAVILDPAGRVLVAGDTTSGDFPVTPNAFQRISGGEYDAFVSILDPELGRLLASTYLGGIDYEWAECIALDGLNRIYVAGETRSTNFPVTAMAYGTNLHGYMDAFITRFDSNLATVSASTFLGGGMADGIERLQIRADALYGAGWTTSTNFPVTALAYSTNYNGGEYDAVVVKLDRDLGSLQASTYLGGAAEDRAYGLALGTDTVYCAGSTGSSNFPVAAHAFQRHFGGGTNDGFAAGLDSSLRELRHGTFLGGTLYEFVQEMALDAQGDLWLAGYTGSSNFPVTARAYCRTNWNTDAFVCRFGAALTNLKAGTLCGGSGDDYGYGMALDHAGNVFVCGYTESDDLPTTPGAYEPFYHRSAIPWYGDGFVAKFDAALSESSSCVLAGDYDGDGKADPALYRSDTGFWYVRLSASAYDLAVFFFGGPCFAAVKGDFDGDGKADPAIYDSVEGAWLVQLPGMGYGTVTMGSFGGVGWQAAPGDYDGDGKTDPAVYHTANGNWRVALSGQAYALAGLNAFGGVGYAAVPENFDADRRFDAAIYDEVAGNWTVLLSAANYITATLWGFGGPGFEPVMGDFDGDRLADPAVYHAAAAAWHVKTSGNGYGTATLAAFGGENRAFGAADYDGDRKADPIILDEGSGLWQVRLSSAGYAEATLDSGYAP